MVDWLGGGAFARYKLTESSSVPLSSLYLIVLFLHLYLTSNPSHLNSIGKSMICSREDEEKKKKAAGKHLVVQRPPPQLKCASLLVTLSDKSDFDPQILNLRSFFGGLEQTIGWRGVTQSVNVKSVLISENCVDYLPYRSTALVAEAFKTSGGRLSWLQLMKVVWMSSYGMWYIEVGVRRGKIQKLFTKYFFLLMII